MTELKATPGPWAYDVTVAFSDRPDLPCVVDEYRLIVAQCWDDGHSDDECEANAHLIAAAPDLYEALDALEYQLGGETDAVKRRFADVRSKARAALAKARGEA